MTDISTQLAAYQGYEKTTVGKNNTPAITVKYTRLDGGDTQRGKDMTVRYLVGRLPQDSKDVLSNLKKGDHFVVIKKKEGEFWNLDSFKPESEYKEKPPSTYPANTQAYTGRQANHANSKPTGGYDNIGAKVGGTVHDAVAIAVAEGKPTVVRIGTLARELLSLSYKLEEEAREGAFDPSKAYNTIPETDTEENYTNDLNDADQIPF